MALPQAPCRGSINLGLKLRGTLNPSFFQKLIFSGICHKDGKGTGTMPTGILLLPLALINDLDPLPLASCHERTNHPKLSNQSLPAFLPGPCLSRTLDFLGLSP